jgi:hypothetical protein
MSIIVLLDQNVMQQYLISDYMKGTWWSRAMRALGATKGSVFVKLIRERTVYLAALKASELCVTFV